MKIAIRPKNQPEIEIGQVEIPEEILNQFRYYFQQGLNPRLTFVEGEGFVADLDNPGPPLQYLIQYEAGSELVLDSSGETEEKQNAESARIILEALTNGDSVTYPTNFTVIVTNPTTGEIHGQLERTCDTETCGSDAASIEERSSTSDAQEQ